ncbi:hypothetical protein Bhyg_14376, partial [Pseudolycoriella hygida]
KDNSKCWRGKTPDFLTEAEADVTKGRIFKNHRISWSDDTILLAQSAFCVEVLKCKRSIHIRYKVFNVLSRAAQDMRHEFTGPKDNGYSHRIPLSEKEKGLCYAKFSAVVVPDKWAFCISIQQVQLVQSKLEGNLNQAYERIIISHQNTTDAFEKVLNDYEKLFDNENKGMRACVQKNIEKMKNISSNGEDKALKCIALSIDEVETIRKRVDPYTESIKSSIANLNKAERCLWSSNPIAVGICVVQNVENVSNSISAIRHDINEVSKLVTVEIYSLEQRARECIQSSLNVAKKAVGNVVAAVNKCVAESSK